MTAFASCAYVRKRTRARIPGSTGYTVPKKERMMINYRNHVCGECYHCEPTDPATTNEARCLEGPPTDQLAAHPGSPNEHQLITVDNRACGRLVLADTVEIVETGSIG